MGGRSFGAGRIGGLGLGGVLLLFILSLVTGQDFLGLLSDPNAPGPAPGGGPVATSPAEEKMVDFVSFVLDENQNTWAGLLGGGYERAKLVLFRDATESGCGFAQSATGPFYCPADQKVYIDLGFFDELDRRFGAAGDFAQAYVLAHEIGHHVQKVVGTEPKVRQLQRANPSRANELSVRMELQADCYAGVWGHTAAAKNHLDPTDAEEGLRAAAAIGDDRIQRMGGGRVAPERFTHGSSAQRMEWLKRGLQSGDPKVCDTFQ